MCHSGFFLGLQPSAGLSLRWCEDFLTCKICYDLYTVPKILPCLHSYCQHCREPLVRDRALQCLECRLQTDVPGGASSLKTNFFIDSLLELFQIKRNRDLACTVCSDAQKILTATARCLDCKDFLCQSCTQGHCCSRLTLHHKVVKLDLPMLSPPMRTPILW
uniref:RING-type domain-containing protein n=1 Tax=Gopherus evgoodei TaxID=1825980 RepID=A0A8C5EZW4_9SAUR